MDIFKKEIKEIISKEKQSFTYKELVEELLTKYPRSFDKRMIEELNESLKELEESKDIKKIKGTEIYEVNKLKDINNIYSYQIEYKNEKWNLYSGQEYTCEDIKHMYNLLCKEMKLNSNNDDDNGYSIIDVEEFKKRFKKKYKFFEIEPKAILKLEGTRGDYMVLEEIK